MDKVVVITGASAGVGRATARAFALEGARVGLIARGHDGLNAARKELEGIGAKVRVYSADVADAAAIEAAAEFFENELGPIDIWVNNAMLSVFSPVKEMQPEEYQRVTEVTYLGYVYGTLSALRRMLPRNQGVIIQVGSTLAYRGIPLQSAYCAAKHAIQGFCDSLRSELLHDKSRVQVSMVQLPAMNTPQFDWVKSRLDHRAQPVPPIFQPEVAARAILSIARHPRREMWVGGPTVKAILANKFIPGLLDRYLGRTNYQAQQTEEPEDSHRPDNLWNPLPGDHGAHGRFDDRSRERSLQSWASEHRGWLALAGLATAGVVTAPFLRRSR